jgi:membrane protein implicated in regulation of membrane protease activity
VLNDVLMVLAALFLAWLIWVGSGWIGYGASWHWDIYVQMMLFVAIKLPLVFLINHLYDFDFQVAGSHEDSAVIRSYTYGMVVR